MKVTMGASEHVPGSYRLARIAVFCALSVIGSFIHLPGPISSVALDSAPGFFAALYFGPVEGAAVTGIGHIATAVINGLPLGLLHFPIAVGLAMAGALVGWINRLDRRFGYLEGIVAGILVNTALIVVAIPTLGWATALSFLPFLFLAASVNGIFAVTVFLAVRRRMPS
jgi:uncharacterized membrane protein